MLGSSMIEKPLPKMTTWNQQRIVRKLERLLDDPEVCPQGVLPAERKLAEILEISRQTLRVVLAELQEHGRIEVQGSTRVAVPLSGPRPSDVDGLVRPTGLLRKHRTIGVVWAHHHGQVRPPLENRVPPGSWAQVRFGIADALQAHGDSVLLLQPGNLLDKPVDWLAAQRLNGLLIGTEVPEEIVAQLTEARQAGRIIITSSDEPWSKPMDRVVPDHQAGAYALTEFLIKRRRRKVLRFWAGVANGSPRPTWLAQRDIGHERAMREASLPVRPAVEFTEAKDTYEKVHDWFEICKHLYAGYLAQAFAADAPDAIMALTDGHVPAVIAACRLLGKRVPEDVAIVGFDNYWADVPERRFEATPPWASVDKHNHDIGQAMVELLLARLTDQISTPPQLRVMKTDLVALPG